MTYPRKVKQNPDNGFRVHQTPALHFRDGWATHVQVALKGDEIQQHQSFLSEGVSGLPAWKDLFVLGAAHTASNGVTKTRSLRHDG